MEERKVKKHVDGNWIDISFKDIKKGDCIRLFEPTGEEVKGIEGGTVFYTMSDAYINDDIYTVDIVG